MTARRVGSPVRLGEELIGSGYAEDVEVAVQLNATQVVPVVQDDCFRPVHDV